MQTDLIQIGLDEKESHIIISLLEYGSQPASIIAKKTNLPRTTALYILEGLFKKELVQKSFIGKTQYFSTSAAIIQESQLQDLQSKIKKLKQISPKLETLEKSQKSPAKIEFFEGLSGCQKAYKKILQSKSEILEFAAHSDLENMGVRFMQEIIKQRTKNKIKINVIAEDTPIHKQYQKLNSKQFRQMTLIPKTLGSINSSITVFDEEIVITNLIDQPFAIHITNKHIAETLKTIHQTITSKA